MLGLFDQSEVVECTFTVLAVSTEVLVIYMSISTLHHYILQTNIGRFTPLH